MTDKTQLKKLSRLELIDMLIELKEENIALKNELEKANQQLESKRIELADVGSIADAALKLSGIFEDAQKACDLYLDNVKETIRPAADE